MNRGIVTIALSAVLVVLGIIVLVETVLVGGTIGYLLGAMLIAVGGLRLLLASRS